MSNLTKIIDNERDIAQNSVLSSIDDQLHESAKILENKCSKILPCMSQVEQVINNMPSPTSRETAENGQQNSRWAFSLSENRNYLQNAKRFRALAKRKQMPLDTTIPSMEEEMTLLIPSSYENMDVKGPSIEERGHPFEVINNMQSVPVTLRRKYGCVLSNTLAGLMQSRWKSHYKTSKMTECKSSSLFFMLDSVHVREVDSLLAFEPTSKTTSSSSCPFPNYPILADIANRLFTISRALTIPSLLFACGFNDAEAKKILKGKITEEVCKRILSVKNTLFFVGGLPLSKLLPPDVFKTAISVMHDDLRLIQLPLPLPLSIFNSKLPFGLHVESDNHALSQQGRKVQEAVVHWNSMTESNAHKALVDEEQKLNLSAAISVIFDPIRKKQIVTIPNECPFQNIDNEAEANLDCIELLPPEPPPKPPRKRLKKKKKKQVSVSTSAIISASHAGERECAYEKAVFQKKPHLPAKTLVKQSSKRPRLFVQAPPSQQEKRKQLNIELRHITPFEAGKGRVKWNEELTRRHGAKISDLLFQILSQLSEVLYDLTTPFDGEKVNDIMDLVAGIPGSVLTYIEANRPMKKASVDRPNNSPTLYAKEMELCRQNEEKPKIEAIETVETENHNLSPSEIKMVERLIARGKIGDAAKRIKQLATEGNYIFSEQETYERLISLHDGQTDISQLAISTKPTDFLTTEGLIIDDSDTMYSIIKSMNNRSACGCDGWSVGLIQAAVERNKANLLLLMRIINAFLIRQFYPRCWFVNRIIGIPKPGRPNQTRPITIPNPFRKLVAKVILHLHKDTMYRAVPEYQFGVGKKLGTESIITMIQNCVDIARIRKQELVVTQMDIESAYPSVDRKIMLDVFNGIQLHPTATSFFQHAFMLDELHFFEGPTPQKIPNTRGLAQGCPLSPIAFAIYAADAMNRINNTAGTADPAHFLQQCKVPRCVGYLDDMFLLSSSMTEAAATLTQLIKSLQESQMTVNLDKTTIFHVSATGEVDINQEIIVEEELNYKITALPTHPSKLAIRPQVSLKVLGSLITINEEHRNEFFQKKAQSALDLIRAAHGLHHQSILLIARMCVASKLNHLLRTLPLHHTLLEAFDTELKELLMQLLEIPSESLTELINMPMSLAGIGIPALTDIQAASIISLQREMIKIGPNNRLIESIKTMSSATTEQHLITELKMPTIQHSTDGLCGCLQAHVTFMSQMSDELKTRVWEMDQHQLWSAHLSGKHKNMLETTKELNESQYITIMANSINTASSAWLRAIPFTAQQKMSDDEVTHSINQKLGSADISLAFVECLARKVGKNGEQLCPICKCKLTPYHSACCQINTATRTARHHLIKGLVAATLKQIPGCKTIVEDFSVHSESNSRRIPDITVELHDAKRTPTTFETAYIKRKRKSSPVLSFGIDLTIRDIHSTSNRDKHLKGQFAEAGEKEKERGYVEFNKTADVYVVPFGISSVGELGPCALSLIGFIKEMGERNSLDINTTSLIEQISLLCETSRAEMEKVYIDELRRRINSFTSMKNQNIHLNSAIKESINCTVKPKTAPFWSKILTRTQQCLQVNSEEHLNDQKRDELNHQLFNWTPQPPPKPPPEDEESTTDDDDESSTSESIIMESDSDDSDDSSEERKLIPSFSSFQTTLSDNQIRNHGHNEATTTTTSAFSQSPNSWPSLTENSNKDNNHPEAFTDSAIEEEI
jgi:hypothetical protein